MKFHEKIVKNKSLAYGVMAVIVLWDLLLFIAICGKYSSFLGINGLFATTYSFIINLIIQVYVLLNPTTLFLTIFYSWLWGPFVLIIVYFFLKTERFSRVRFVEAINSTIDVFVKQKIMGTNRVTNFILITVGIIITILIYFFRFTMHFVPQGFDTPSYLFILNWWRKDIIYGITVRNYTRPIFFAVLFVLSMFFTSSEDLLIALPIFNAIFYAIAVGFFVKVGTKDNVLAAISMSLASISFFKIRMSYDLYSNFLYLGFMVIFLALTLKAFETKKIKYILAATLFTFITILTHPWSWIITILMLWLFAIFRFIDLRKGFFREFLILFLILLPSTVIILAIVLTNPSFLFLYDVRWFTLPRNWYWLATRESGIILFFALVGLIVFIFRRENFYRLVVSWTFVLPLLLVILGYLQPYRFFILLPLGILAAQGIYTIFALIYNYLLQHFEFRVKKLDMKAIVLLAMILPAMISVLRVSYIPEYVYYPDKEAIDQLYWIQNHFGFENENIIVPIFYHQAPPIEPKSSNNLYNWAKAIIGARVYWGHLLHLSMQETDVFGNRFDVSNVNIILADKLYRISYVEMEIGNQISDGIYVISIDNMTQLLQIYEQMVFSGAMWLENDFINWKILEKNDLVSINIKGDLNIQLSCSIPPNSVALVLTRNLTEYNIELNESSTIYIKLKNNITEASIVLGINYYYNSTTIKTKEYPITITSENYTWSIIPVFEQLKIESIYLRISSSGYITQPGELTIAFIVFV